MNIVSIFKKLDKSKYIFINQEELDQILKMSKIIFIEDTLVSDFIRILKIEDFYFFQEKTPKGEIIIRKFCSELEAQRFANKRLNLYEKMWNGCGCKIDYHSS